MALAVVCSKAISVAVDPLLSVASTVCGALCYVLVLLCPFYFFNHLDGKERAGCFILIIFLNLVTVSVLWLFLVVP